MLLLVEITKKDDIDVSNYEEDFYMKQWHLLDKKISNMLCRYPVPVGRLPVRFQTKPWKQTLHKKNYNFINN